MVSLLLMGCWGTQGRFAVGKLCALYDDHAELQNKYECRDRIESMEIHRGLQEGRQHFLVGTTCATKAIY